MSELAVIPLPQSHGGPSDGGALPVPGREEPIRLDRRLRVLGRTAFEALIIVDDERRYVRINPAATRILGAPAEQIVGRYIEDFTPREHWPLLQRLWTRFRVDGVLEGGYLVQQGNGNRQPINFRADWNFGPGEHLIVAIEAPVAEEPVAQTKLLTKREIEILCLVADGHSNEDVARELMLSPATVKTHLQNVYRKLEVPDRAAAVAAALRARLIS
jgi:PAS domain S-box-containing protein